MKHLPLLILFSILFVAQDLTAQDCDCVEKDSYEYVEYKGRYRTLRIPVECDSLFSMEVINDFLNFGDIYYEVAQDFFASFQNRARRLWGRLSSPFQTSKVDDLKDFLAADDDYEEEEDAQEALAHRQVDSLRQDPQEDSNDFISKIQRKYAETSSVEYDDGEEDDEEDGDSELEIVGKPPATLGEDNEDTEMNGYYSVEEEVSDPWEVSIKRKIKRKKLSKVSPSATPKIRKKISRKSLSASAQKRGTHALEDSDSDFEA